MSDNREWEQQKQNLHDFLEYATRSGSLTEAQRIFHQMVSEIMFDIKERLDAEKYVQ